MGTSGTGKVRNAISWLVCSHKQDDDDARLLLIGKPMIGIASFGLHGRHYRRKLPLANGGEAQASIDAGPRSEHSLHHLPTSPV